MDVGEVTKEFRLAQWAQIFQERKIEGKRVRDFCQSRGIGKHMYYYWLRKVREATCEQLELRDPSSVRQVMTGFAKVQVAEKPALPEPSNAESIRIEYGGVKISVGGAYAPDKLAVFVRELART